MMFFEYITVDINEFGLANSIGLGHLIINAMKKRRLYCSHVVGQGYNETHGWTFASQEYVLKECDRAVYLQCGAHSLSLAITDS